jgi:hypothetical protein
VGRGPRCGAHTTRHAFGAALACLACGIATAQSEIKTGSLSGRLTDLWSHPVAGATVVLRNEATGAEARLQTGATTLRAFPPADTRWLPCRRPVKES